MAGGGPPAWLSAFWSGPTVLERWRLPSRTRCLVSCRAFPARALSRWHHDAKTLDLASSHYPLVCRQLMLVNVKKCLLVNGREGSKRNQRHLCFRTPGNFLWKVLGWRVSPCQWLKGPGKPLFSKLPSRAFRERRGWGPSVEQDRGISVTAIVTHELSCLLHGQKTLTRLTDEAGDTFLLVGVTRWSFCSPEK